MNKKPYYDHRLIESLEYCQFKGIDFVTKVRITIRISNLRIMTSAHSKGYHYDRYASKYSAKSSLVSK